MGTVETPRVPAEQRAQQEGMEAALSNSGTQAGVHVAVMQCHGIPGLVPGMSSTSPGWITLLLLRFVLLEAPRPGCVSVVHPTQIEASTAEFPVPAIQMHSQNLRVGFHGFAGRR